MNFDSIFAEAVSKNIEFGIPHSFIKAATKTYLLNIESIVEGIKLLTNSHNDIEIISLHSGYNIQRLLSNNFSNVAYLIGGTRQMSDTIFLIRKRDFPQIQYEKAEEDDIKNYRLKLVDDSIKLYTSVVDINLPENSDLKDNLNDNGELKVLVAVTFAMKIHWRRDREIIMIRVSSKYKEQGIENTLSELIPIT